MGLFNNFPYMDLSNLNLDFILKKLKDLTNYAESAEQDAHRAETASSIAVLARDAAEASAASAQSSARDAQLAENSAENYAAHIADPVGGLVTGWLDDNITPTTPPVDASLTIQGAAADAKATGDAIDDLSAQMVANEGFTYEVKTLIEELFRSVMLFTINNADQKIDDLHDAMFPPTGLTSISAVYNQTRVIYNVSNLNELRDDLTVTAHYSDSSDRVVTGYTLTGTLTPGTSNITVNYQGKTTTISVNVTDFMLNDVLTLDGILNTRNGHDTSATTWEDLSGNENDFAKMSGASNVIWGNDYAGFDATNRTLTLTKDLFANASAFTIEVVADITGNGSYVFNNIAYGAMLGNRIIDTSLTYGFGAYTYNLGMSSRYCAANTGFTSFGGLIKHVVWVFDGTNITRYVNGVAQTPVAQAFPSGATQTVWAIGGYPDEAKYIHAHMHRIGMSARAMTAEEITARFNFFKDRFNITEE